MRFIQSAIVNRIILITAAAMILACAAGSPPQRPPRDLRKSIRYLNKGVTLYTKGCYQRALVYFRESHEHYTAADNLSGVANSLHSIANIYLQLDDIDSALLVYQEAIDTYKSLENEQGQARAWANCAVALIKAGRLEQAAQALEHSDQLAAPDQRLQALRAKNRALLLIAKQQEAKAEKLLTRTLKTTSGGDSITLAGLHFTLGQLQLNQGRAGQAIPHLQKALELDRSAGAYIAIARDLETLGSSYTHLERLTEAIRCQKRSAKIYALLGNPEKVQTIIGQLEANAARAQTDIQAVTHWASQWLAGNKEANLCR